MPLSAPCPFVSSAPLDLPDPPSSTPEGTPIPSVVILKNQPVPVAMADDAYPGWLWKLIGEGKELVAQGKESAERGEEWDARAERRKMRSM